MNVTLIGGGWDLEAQRACLTPFVSSAASRAGGRPPRVAFVWVDEGDGVNWGERWIELLRQVAELQPVDVAVPWHHPLAPSLVAGVDGLFVCGGLTPAYAESLAPAAGPIRAAVEDGLPYAGSSAGAAVAARDAVVGGYLDAGVVVCPADAAEDLDDVTVTPGLGLVDAMVDVHASAWGTLPRLATAMRQAGAPRGLGIDENTAWHVDAGHETVLGANAVHELTLRPRACHGGRGALSLPI